MRFLFRCSQNPYISRVSKPAGNGITPLANITANTSVSFVAVADSTPNGITVYFRTGGIEQDQLSKYDSDVETLGEWHYVVLRNVRGTLAVYRIRNDGQLKQLKRWKALGDNKGF